MRVAGDLGESLSPHSVAPAGASPRHRPSPSLRSATVSFSTELREVGTNTANGDIETGGDADLPAADAATGGSDDEGGGHGATRRTWLPCSIGVLVCSLALTMLSSISGMFYIYGRGWYVLMKHGNQPCNRPIAAWLLGCQVLAPLYFARGCLRPCLMRWLCRYSPDEYGQPEPLRVKMFSGSFCFICYFFVFSGVDLVKDAKSCEEEAPDLYGWVSYLFPSGLVHFFALQILAICSSAALLAAVSRSPLSMEASARPADPSVIQKLKTLTIDSTYVDRQCSICLEDYNEGQLAKELTCCKNVIHETCLEEWLRRRRSCPLCRTDLQAAVEADSEAEAVELPA